MKARIHILLLAVAMLIVTVTTLRAQIVADGATNTLSNVTNAIVSWQPTFAGWLLQDSQNLAPVAWSNSPSGAINPVSVPATNETMFYRLIKP